LDKAELNDKLDDGLSIRIMCPTIWIHTAL